MRRSRAATALLLALLAAAPYLEVTEHHFLTLDDPLYVHEHPTVRAPFSWQSVALAFREPHDGNWIPLTWLSLQLGTAIHGAWAPGYLIANLVLHGASTAVLFLALVRMTGAWGPSAFTAAVFGVHPLHVESVAWVAERKDVLSGLFFALTLLAYGRFAERTTRARSALVAAGMAMGLLAKPMLVTLPFVLLLLDHWPLGRLHEPGGTWPSPRRVARAMVEKLPLFALSAVGSAIAWHAQRGEGAMGFGATLDLPARLANALVSVACYAGKAVWPTGLAAYYPYPDALPTAQVVLSAALVAFATALGVACARSRAYLLVGWLWYLGMLVPVLGIVQLGMQARADRYTYLPLIGLALALAWGVRDLAGARYRALATAGAAGAVGALALAAAAQVGHWRDSRTLFERTLAVTRDNYLVHGFLARDHLAARRVDEAERHYREALRLRPRWLEPRLGLADVELARGRAGEALTVYEAVLREQPGHPGALARLGLARLRLGRFAEARAPLELALAAYPHAPALHLAFALLEGAVGDPVAALRHERAAVRLDPDDPAAANNLAWRLATAARPELRDPAEALRLSSRVVDSTGGSDPGALDTLAAAQAAGGDFASALRSAERALHLAAERGDAALVDAIRARRASYAAGRAWVEGASEAAR